MKSMQRYLEDLKHQMSRPLSSISLSKRRPWEQRPLIGQVPELAYAAVKAAVEASSVPVYVKLTPSVADITQVAKQQKMQGRLA